MRQNGILVGLSLLKGRPLQTKRLPFCLCREPCVLTCFLVPIRLCKGGSSWKSHWAWSSTNRLIIHRTASINVKNEGKHTFSKNILCSVEADVSKYFSYTGSKKFSVYLWVILTYTSRSSHRYCWLPDLNKSELSLDLKELRVIQQYEVLKTVHRTRL